MTYQSYTDINSLEEMCFIAGNTYTLNFNVYQSDGINVIPLSGATTSWKLCQYGNPDIAVLTINGVITGISTFQITLSKEDTENLRGKYIQQPIVTVFSGDTYIVGQGIISIYPIVDTDTSTILAEEWQNSGDLVQVGGISESDFVLNTTFGDGTIINTISGIFQNCEISQITVHVNTTDGATPWSFKLFRWNEDTSLFDFVDERTFTPLQVGTQTFTFSTPLDVLIGDCSGLYVPSGELVSLTLASGYTIGSRSVSTTDVTTSNSFVSTTGREINMTCLGNRPYISVVGDSITAGSNNGTVGWNCRFGKINGVPIIPGGEPTSEIIHQTSLYLPSVQYQNNALGGQTWAWGRSTGVPAAVASNSKIIYIAFGINDINTSRLWDDVLTDMDEIRLLIPNETKLMIQEILPCTSAGDVSSAKIRLWNTYYFTWCIQNNAELVGTHDLMGQIRPSTGQLDDFVTGYSNDGLHLTTLGVQKMADIINLYFK